MDRVYGIWTVEPAQLETARDICRAHEPSGSGWFSEHVNAATNQPIYVMCGWISAAQSDALAAADLVSMTEQQA